MRVYEKEYLNDVVENQGKLFDYVSYKFPEYDTKHFIESYMNSKTRASIDNGQAYVSTMDYKELLEYFVNTDKFKPVVGETIQGFIPEWIGQFYAYYQWYYNIKSNDIIKKIPVDFLKNAYRGLHDLDLELAVKKVGQVK